MNLADTDQTKLYGPLRLYAEAPTASPAGNLHAGFSLHILGVSSLSPLLLALRMPSKLTLRDIRQIYHKA